MLGFNPFVAQQLVGERMTDAMREAKEARLMQTAKGPREWQRLGVQLGRLAMIWLPLPGWFRVCFLAVGSQASHCY